MILLPVLPDALFDDVRDVVLDGVDEDRRGRLRRHLQAVDRPLPAGSSAGAGVFHLPTLRGSATGSRGR